MSYGNHEYKDKYNNFKVIEVLVFVVAAFLIWIASSIALIPRFNHNDPTTGIILLAIAGTAMIITEAIRRTKKRFAIYEDLFGTLYVDLLKIWGERRLQERLEGEREHIQANVSARLRKLVERTRAADCYGKEERKLKDAIRVAQILAESKGFRANY